MKKCTDKEIKDTLFDILVYFDKLCNEYNLNYTLDSGTLLGAARHKDFIPWDDDIDVAMPYEDYKKLVNLGDEVNRLNNNFRLHGYSKKINNKEHYIYPFLKLENKNTIAKFHAAKDSGGAWIDIFPLNGVPNDKNIYIKYAKKMELYHSLLGKGDTINQENIVKKVGRKIIRLGSNYYRDRMVKMLDELGTVHSNKIADTVWANDRINTLFPSDIINNYTKLEFRGKKFYTVKEYDKYLTIQYGNWRKLPPKEQRVAHHEYDLYML
ncbi:MULTISPECIES: phosphorylcholine transferase LicD [unclassified Lactobacillus]|uniref:LicD family protein n=1 Tax=unclassified Lactobacillus TaxID=2620435 RepID=UPI000BEEC42A|nr:MULTISPECIES: LicD family protein [unclassified Lactobacillus]PEG86527.1 hypothetical protein CP365_07440 [Lactobacillus sp. UMNPBX14]PEH02075.1 hypothetical protein CP357_07450 [Lactobacillus sp. UMNPBX6]